MDIKFIAVVAKAQDKGDYDKLLRLLTPEGVITATVKGVKRPNAKLKAMAVPFAFCEFSAAKKGNSYVITGASPIEDLLKICDSPESLTAGGIILEAAISSFGTECADKFVYMLHRIKDIIYSKTNPYIQAIRFLQYIIHNSGYAYEYQKYDEVKTPLHLLSFLHYSEDSTIENNAFDGELVLKTLIKIIASFENKMDTEILSKNLLAFSKTI